MRLELEGKKPASRVVVMEMLSERYGWTPDQIRAMDQVDVEQYVEILLAKQNIDKVRQMRQRK